VEVPDGFDVVLLSDEFDGSALDTTKWAFDPATTQQTSEGLQVGARPRLLHACCWVLTLRVGAHVLLPMSSAACEFNPSYVLQTYSMNNVNVANSSLIITALKVHGRDSACKASLQFSP
jgi:hypothetical protein